MKYRVFKYSAAPPQTLLVLFFHQVTKPFINNNSSIQTMKNRLFPPLHLKSILNSSTVIYRIIITVRFQPIKCQSSAVETLKSNKLSNSFLNSDVFSVSWTKSRALLQPRPGRNVTFSWSALRISLCCIQLAF